ncbi:MAG: Rieske (2Fe-2S) protein [Actinomadura rubrobrunea]|nr:Rieske (2Fe-2S) protein [Actinomadura rubrobrunea]
MTGLGRARTRRERRLVPLRLRRPVRWQDQRATWRDARPSIIAGALKRAAARPSGNWYVLGASADIGGGRPFARTIAGVEVIAWRGRDGLLRAGPGVCPHLGAPLRDARVLCGRVVCHWHGLVIDGAPYAGWEPFPAYDDGVLAWVRLDAVGGEPPLERPLLPTRPDPARRLEAVFSAEGVCEPEDVIANRLDPWHGGWLHPYSFVDLTVRRAPAERTEDAADDCFLVDVSFKVAGRAVVPVRARFTAPGPRTVVMHIIEGEGRTSAVETHAVPLGPGPDGAPRTAVVEAVLAASDRPGFSAARAMAPLVRPLMRRVAGRLWRDDLAYAERRWRLRATGRFPG